MNGLTNIPRVLLASKSPRRQDLLREAGIDFQLINVDVEEDFSPEMDVNDVPEFLAKKKIIYYITLDTNIIDSFDSK